MHVYTLINSIATRVYHAASMYTHSSYYCAFAHGSERPWWNMRVFLPNITLCTYKVTLYIYIGCPTDCTQPEHHAHYLVWSGGGVRLVVSRTSWMVQWRECRLMWFCRNGGPNITSNLADLKGIDGHKSNVGFQQLLLWVFMVRNFLVNDMQSWLDQIFVRTNQIKMLRAI